MVLTMFFPSVSNLFPVFGLEWSEAKALGVSQTEHGEAVKNRGFLLQATPKELISFGVSASGNCRL
jgi:uncharacterized protein (DUF697 family)